MPQSLFQLYVHLVFSTKHRRQFIPDLIAPNLYAYMATVFYDECRPPLKLIGAITFMPYPIKLVRGATQMLLSCEDDQGGL